MAESGGLMIGGVRDPAEKEADRIAEHVMRMPPFTRAIQRKCPECEAEDKQALRQANEEAAE